MTQEYWQEPIPTECEICHAELGEGKIGVFVDGKTKLGPWGIMCPRCHAIHGVGLGTGKGQRYMVVPGGSLWIKVEG